VGQTPDSLWQTVAGDAITDDLLAWPPDLFALANVVLEHTQAYRLLFCPPAGAQWPPGRFAHWSEAVEDAGRQWSAWAEDHSRTFPRLLADEWHVFRSGVTTPMEDLAEARDWRLCESVFTLLAISDEACAGLGVALDRSDGQGCVYRARGRELLATTGSLARIRSPLVRVLPKVRTPPGGTNLASLSRYACVLGPGVDVRWYKMPARRRGISPQAEHTNVLLLPWPLRVREADFASIEGSVQPRAEEAHGLFEFAPSEGIDLDLLDRVLSAAEEEVDSVDVVLLPESAVDEHDVHLIEALLDSHRVGYLVTGVRQRARGSGQLPGNWVHIGVSARLEKGGPAPVLRGQPWFHVRQDKHHRWSLDEAQINQYHLGGALHPHIRWWEATHVPRRAVSFIEVHELTITILVCEDLAQSDSVSEVIRSVGPNLLVTPLLDGPQLLSRWSARYASVFGDDPGSAVLTLTSYGMVQRSRPAGREASSVIALWKAPGRGAREIQLEAGAQGVLLTACTDRAIRRSADGRLPAHNATEYFDVAVFQVRAPTPSASPLPSPSVSLDPPVLDIGELTIVTAWVEAVAEALAYAPRCLPTVLEQARSSSKWRAELGIGEPSSRVDQAIEYVAAFIAALSTRTDPPSVDEILVATELEGQGEEDEQMAGICRRLLRSTLELLLTRERAPVRSPLTTT
jgi:hypothetical protein